jgi:hypothetical protein
VKDQQHGIAFVAKGLEMERALMSGHFESDLGQASILIGRRWHQVVCVLRTPAEQAQKNGKKQPKIAAK